MDGGSCPRDPSTLVGRHRGRRLELAVAVEELFEVGGSSPVVASHEDRPLGSVTKTDVLDALTREAEGTRAVRRSNADLLDDMPSDGVVPMVDRLGEVDADVAVLDAEIQLHEHDETRRGTPLLVERMRLHTDRSHTIATGEGDVATPASNEAGDVIARRTREDKPRPERETRCRDVPGAALRLVARGPSPRPVHPTATAPTRPASSRSAPAGRCGPW